MTSTWASEGRDVTVGVKMIAGTFETTIAESAARGHSWQEVHGKRLPERLLHKSSNGFRRTGGEAVNESNCEFNLESMKPVVAWFRVLPREVDHYGASSFY